MYQVQVGHKHRNTHNSTQHIQRCRGFLVSSCELPSGSPFLFSPIPVPVKPLTVFCPSRSAFLFHFSSVQCSCSVVSNPLQPHESQHTRPPCPSPIPGVHSNHVHGVCDAIQPSHPLSSPSPSPDPSQHKGLFE